MDSMMVQELQLRNNVRLGGLIAYSVGMLFTPKNIILLILSTYLHINIA